MLGEENVYKLFVQVACLAFITHCKCCKAVAQVEKYDKEATSVIIRAINATKFEDKSKITKLKFLTVGKR